MIMDPDTNAVLFVSSILYCPDIASKRLQGFTTIEKERNRQPRRKTKHRLRMISTKVHPLIRSMELTICMSMLVNDRHLTDESRILSHEGQHGDRSVLTVCIAAKNAGPSQRNTLRFIQQSDGRRLLRLRNAIHSVG